MLVKTQGEKEPLSILVGLKISAATMEINMEVPPKTITITITWFCSTTLGHISEGIKVSMQQRYLNTQAYSSTAHNSQAMELA
jgi:hypothetical protein